jgi:hypothetical protein
MNNEELKFAKFCVFGIFACTMGGCLISEKLRLDYRLEALKVGVDDADF